MDVIKQEGILNKLISILVHSQVFHVFFSLLKDVYSKEVSFIFSLKGKQRSHRDTTTDLNCQKNSHEKEEASGLIP